MQRPDGATDTRTLLPGIDLRVLLPDSIDGDGSSADEGAGGEGAQGGLAVLQTPQGVSLREALSRELSLRTSAPRSKPASCLAPGPPAGASSPPPTTATVLR